MSSCSARITTLAIYFYRCGGSIPPNIKLPHYATNIFKLIHIYYWLRVLKHIWSYTVTFSWRSAVWARNVSSSVCKLYLYFLIWWISFVSNNYWVIFINKGSLYGTRPFHLKEVVWFCFTYKRRLAS